MAAAAALRIDAGAALAARDHCSQRLARLNFRQRRGHRGALLAELRTAETSDDAAAGDRFIASRASTNLGVSSYEVEKGSLQRSPTESPESQPHSWVDCTSHEYRISHCSSHEVETPTSASQLVSQTLMERPSHCGHALL